MISNNVQESTNCVAIRYAEKLGIAKAYFREGGIRLAFVAAQQALAIAQGETRISVASRREASKLANHCARLLKRRNDRR